MSNKSGRLMTNCLQKNNIENKGWDEKSYESWKKKRQK